ncbi:hypothetical protein T484DRAFT_3629739 [Baffinella frigidus]|nr:hypothetical protein T484DRAFT_3629739 [Cryptophyta sp. CCMP2293]
MSWSSMMPSRGDAESLHELTCDAQSLNDLPAEPSLPTTPSGTTKASNKMSYLNMMRTISQGDDDSFYGLMSRLNSTGDLDAGCSRCSTTPTGIASSADRSTSPSPPGTPQRFERVFSKGTSRLERVVHHISLENSLERIPRASSEFSRLESVIHHIPRNASSPEATCFERTSNHVSRVGAASSAESSPAARNSPKTPSHVDKTQAPRLEQDLLTSRVTSPRYMLSPPPSPELPERADSSGHRDSAVFLARMLKSESKKEQRAQRGVAPTPLAHLRSGMEQWASAPQIKWASAPQAKSATSSFKHTVKNMRVAMKEWSSARPPP